MNIVIRDHRPTFKHRSWATADTYFHDGDAKGKGADIWGPLGESALWRYYEEWSRRTGNGAREVQPVPRRTMSWHKRDGMYRVVVEYWTTPRFVWWPEDVAKVETIASMSLWGAWRGMAYRGLISDAVRDDWRAYKTFTLLGYRESY